MLDSKAQNWPRKKENPPGGVVRAESSESNAIQLSEPEKSGCKAQRFDSTEAKVESLRAALRAFLRLCRRRSSSLSPEADAQFAICNLHARMIVMNGGECPAPLLAQVQADFHRLEELRQSVSEVGRAGDGR